METYIEHHGILGQKWGVRRYQNPDGTLTTAGKKHVSAFKEHERLQSEVKKEGRKLFEDKRLQRDLVSIDNVDDVDLLELTCKEYRIDTKAFRKALSKSESYYANNAKMIKTGKKIVDRLGESSIKGIVSGAPTTVSDMIKKEQDRFKRPTLADERKRNSTMNI